MRSFHLHEYHFKVSYRKKYACNLIAEKKHLEW